MFLAYLGTASYFIFSKNRDEQIEHSKGELFSLLVKGPIWVFSLAAIGAIFAFGFSNRPSAETGSGMSVDLLSGSISGILGLLAVTTNVIVAYLFSTGGAEDETLD